MTDGFSDQLLDRARQLDPVAITRITELFGPRVFGLLRKVTRDSDLAEELVQETFLRMIRRIADFEPTGKFESWLFSIAINLARDQIRRSRRRGSVYSWEEAADGDAEMSGRPQTTQSQPAAALEAAEDAAQLEACFARLSATERELLSLRHYADMSFRDIAEMLGIPLGTALARSHRALQKLRAMMEEQDDDKAD